MQRLAIEKDRRDVGLVQQVLDVGVQLESSPFFFWYSALTV